jgi:16S rRNA (guanine527-N7)-methyltransferase
VKQSSRYLTKEEHNDVLSLFVQNQEELRDYVDVLLWWNSKINLVSRDVSRETVVEHVRHSLYVTLASGFTENKLVLDTGSGGGLPGIPLSICSKNKSYRINDIVSKKIFAVNDMINKLGISGFVSGFVGDVRSVELEKNSLIITKHAFGLDQLYEMVKDKPWSSIVFLKGSEEAVKEAKEIKDPISLSIIKLDTSFMSPFYKGKAVVELKRIAHE